MDSKNLVKRLGHTSDILEVLKVLIEIRTAAARSTTSITRQPPRAFGRRNGRERFPHRPRARRARGQRAPVAGRAEGLTPQDLINAKPVAAAIKEFFGSSQLSQFMDQKQPAQRSHDKRRVPHWARAA